MLWPPARRISLQASGVFPGKIAQKDSLPEVLIHIRQEPEKESSLTVKELPYTIAMIVLDIAAPICLLFVLLAYICWGIENNCTRELSS